MASDGHDCVEYPCPLGCHDTKPSDDADRKAAELLRPLHMQEHGGYNKALNAVAAALRERDERIEPCARRGGPTDCEQMERSYEIQGEHVHEMEERIAALEAALRERDAKIAELEKDADEECRVHQHTINTVVDQRDKFYAFLTRAVEAMRKVPHLWGAPEGRLYAPKHPCLTYAEKEECARLGGACAFAPLIEEIEKAQR